jgi:hypothetical protein
MTRVGGLATLVTVLLLLAAAHVNMIEPDTEELKPVAALATQNNPASGLSTFASSTQSAGGSQKYSTSFTKYMDLESNHKTKNGGWDDDCYHHGYEFESEFYIDYNMRVRHTGSTTVTHSVDARDGGGGELSIKQTGMQSSYEVTIKPEIVFRYRLEVSEMKGDCTFWDDGALWDEYWTGVYVYADTLRLPLPSSYQEYSGQQSVSYGSKTIYLWTENAVVSGINQPGSTTGFMLDENIRVSTIDLLPIFEWWFGVDLFDGFWIDVEIPLSFNIDVTAQAQHAIEYAMAIDGGFFSGSGEMRISSDPTRLFGSDMGKTEVSRAWNGNGGDVRVLAIPSMVYQIHAEITGSIDIGIVVTMLEDFIILVDQSWELWSGYTHTDSYSHVLALNPAVLYTYTAPTGFFDSEYEVMGTNIDAITGMAGIGTLLILVILLMAIMRSSTRRRRRRWSERGWSDTGQRGVSRAGDSGGGGGPALNWEDPFAPSNDLVSSTQALPNQILQVKEQVTHWDALRQEWCTLTQVPDHTHLPGGGSYIADDAGTHYYAPDGDDWLLQWGGSFVLQANSETVASTDDRTMQDQTGMGDDDSYFSIGNQSSPSSTAEWLEWPESSGSWWYREHILDEWHTGEPSPDTSRVEHDLHSTGLVTGQIIFDATQDGDATSTDGDPVDELVEHPVGSGNWWAWDAAGAVWQRQEPEVHAGAIQEDTFATDGVAEFTPDPTEFYSGQSHEQLGTSVEPTSAYKEVHLHPEIVGQEEASIQQAHDPNHVCWVCVQPLSATDWTYCPSCGARYHGSAPGFCGAGALTHCRNCTQPAHQFVAGSL